MTIVVLIVVNLILLVVVFDVVIDVVVICDVFDIGIISASSSTADVDIFDFAVISASTSTADVVVLGEGHLSLRRFLACVAFRLLAYRFLAFWLLAWRFRACRLLAVADNYLDRRARLLLQEDVGRDELVEDAPLTEARQTDDRLDDGDKNGDENEAERGI